MTNFIGRQPELKTLNDLQKRKKAAIVVIKGRRRIGKSRLIAEFARNCRFINITGQPPEPGSTAQDQLDNFIFQLEKATSIRAPRCRDWREALDLVSDNLNDEPTVILFDEISWMGSRDPTFIPKIKVWWDQVLQHRNNVMLFFCGSVSTWIEENIIKSTGFFGRITQIIELKPLKIRESAQMLEQIGFKGSVIDRYKILSVFGGIPWYLEQISPFETADANIHRLCFDNKGLMTLEFDRIFHDLFSQRGDVYIQIMNALKEGAKSLLEIRQAINYAQSGSLSKLVEHLTTAGFISHHAQWSFKTGQQKRQSLYRICDPFMRFYLHYMAPQMEKIQRGQITDMAHLPGYNSMIGLQLESLLLQNRDEIIQALGINPMDVVHDNPYIQRKNASHAGCQIDYLVQTRTNTLYVCEFKFQTREIKSDILDSMKDKLKALSKPLRFGVVPALFHVSGASAEVELSSYFYRIVDICDWIDPR